VLVVADINLPLHVLSITGADCAVYGHKVHWIRDISNLCAIFRIYMSHIPLRCLWILSAALTACGQRAAGHLSVPSS
jgi:hypothetical protein